MVDKVLLSGISMTILLQGCLTRPVKAEALRVTGVLVNSIGKAASGLSIRPVAFSGVGVMKKS